jgi:hypothetical protein
VRNDARIMNKLHRRVFLDKIGMEDVKIYISFYVEASNRDAFMAVKQVSVHGRSWPSGAFMAVGTRTPPLPLASAPLSCTYTSTLLTSSPPLLCNICLPKQDLLLAFVDCVERNGAMLAVPRTVLELDPSMDPDALLPSMGRMTPIGGLLPAPGGVVGGYGGRGPNIPITVQVGLLWFVCGGGHCWGLAAC